MGEAGPEAILPLVVVLTVSWGLWRILVVQVWHVCPAVQHRDQ